MKPIQVKYYSPITGEFLAVKSYASVKSARIAARRFDLVYGAHCRKIAENTETKEQIFI